MKKNFNFLPTGSVMKIARDLEISHTVVSEILSEKRKKSKYKEAVLNALQAIKEKLMVDLRKSSR